MGKAKKKNRKLKAVPQINNSETHNENNQISVVEIKSKEIDIEKEFELREKRLKLVYKVLYILAVVWAALIISYTNNIGVSAPIYCGLLAALTTSLLNVLYYIVGEFRCLRIKKTLDTQTQEEADNKFLEIWNKYGVSLCVSLFLSLINICFSTIVNKCVISIAIVVGVLALYFNTMAVEKQIVKSAIRNIATTIVCYAFFSIMQLQNGMSV